VGNKEVAESTEERMEWARFGMRRLTALHSLAHLWAWPGLEGEAVPSRGDSVQQAL